MRPKPYPFPVSKDEAEEAVFKKIVRYLKIYYEKKDKKRYLQLFNPLSPEYQRIKRLAEQDFQEYSTIKVNISRFRIEKLSPGRATISFQNRFTGKGVLKNKRAVPMKSWLQFKRYQGEYRLFSLQTEPLKIMPAQIPKLKKASTREEREIWRKAKAIQKHLASSKIQELELLIHPDAKALKTWKEQSKKKKERRLSERVEIEVVGGKAYVHPLEANIHIYFYAHIEESFPYTNRFNAEGKLELVKLGGIWKIHNLEFKKL